MAEKYLAGFPTVPCELCDKPTDQVHLKLCVPCWNLRQIVRGHAANLLADPKTAPRVHALFASAEPLPVPAEPT